MIAQGGIDGNWILWWELRRIRLCGPLQSRGSWILNLKKTSTGRMLLSKTGVGKLQPLG